MKMPIGKYKGQPVKSLTTAYLAWLVSQDHIRFKRWPLIKEALRVLRSRFDNQDELYAELQPDKPPAEYWKAKPSAKRKKEQAEKLRILEEQRAEDRRKRVEKIQAHLQQKITQDRVQQLIQELERRNALAEDVSDLI